MIDGISCAEGMKIESGDGKKILIASTKNKQLIFSYTPTKKGGFSKAATFTFGQVAEQKNVMCTF